MPFDIRPIADEDSQGNRLESITWAASDSDTLYLKPIDYSNPPENVGLCTLFIETTDTGGGTPTISVYLQFKYNDAYGPEHTVKDDDDNTSFTSGDKFEARLDTQDWWKIHKDWRIKLVRSASSALKIDYAYGVSL